MFCAKNNPVPECTILFGCKLSLAMVSNSERVRSSDLLPSGGTSVVVVVLEVGVDAGVEVEVEVEVEMVVLEPLPLLQAAIPTTRQMLMINRFTPVRLCIHEPIVAKGT